MNYIGSIAHKLVQSSVKDILQAGHRRPISDWSLQGLGMLRLKMTNDLRLHVWSPKHAWVTDATIHSHPWRFASYIVCGEIHNSRLMWNPNGERRGFKRRLIQCGEGGCALGEEEIGDLRAGGVVESYHQGQTYGQRADEIHLSTAGQGTVSIIERKGDTGQAHVYYQGAWDSAEPRTPTTDELLDILSSALTILEGEINASK